MPKVSVVIPCFNQGHYIDEAVNSVLGQTFQDFEIIVVNDGSTDDFTNNHLNNYKKPKTKVITTKNMGLASARNNGIREATGEYILPLDADDKIGEEYLELAVEILDQNPKIGIVYCEAEFFEGRSDLWYLPEYSLVNILMSNVIFCSAFFRKLQWEKVGGYNPNMVNGWEDWDFWLSLIEFGVQVYMIPKVLFFYRIKNESMILNLFKNKINSLKMFLQIIINHKDLYFRNIEILGIALEKYIRNNKLNVYLQNLYIDTGSGFNEKELVQGISESSEDKNFSIAFNIPPLYMQIKSLRFDPLEGQPCKCKIESVETDGIYKGIAWKNASEQENDYDVFYTVDPLYVFDGAFSNATYIKITGKIEILDYDVILKKLDLSGRELNRIINYVKCQIAVGIERIWRKVRIIYPIKWMMKLYKRIAKKL